MEVVNQVTEVTIEIVEGGKGNDGASATVNVGTTTTLPAGSSATVENVGDENNAIFNFGIPKGVDGVTMEGVAVETVEFDEDNNVNPSSMKVVADWIAEQDFGNLPLNSGYINTSVGVGNEVDLTPIADSNSKYGIVDAEEKDIFYIKGKGGSSPRLWCFIDENNTILEVASPILDVYNNPIIIIAPENTSKAIFNLLQSPYTDGYISNLTPLEKEINKKVNNLIPVSLTQDEGYYNLSGGIGSVAPTNATSTYDGDLCGVIDCVEGDCFTLKSSGGSNSRAYAFVDENNIILEVAPASANYFDNPIIITAPENTVKVYFNNNTNNDESYILKTSDEGNFLNKKVNEIDLDSIDELKKTADTDLIFIENGYINTSVGVGNVVDLTPIADNTVDYNVTDCVEGDVFYIKLRGGSSPRMYCFVDESNIILEVANGSTSSYDSPEFITAPENTSKVILQAIKASPTNEYYAYQLSEISVELYNLATNGSSDILQGQITANTTSISNEIANRILAISQEVIDRNQAISDALQDFNVTPNTATVNQSDTLTESKITVPSDYTVNKAIESLNSEGVIEKSVVISDTLNYTAVNAQNSAYNDDYGLFCMAYQPRVLGSYGEASGIIAISIFSPSQPSNIRYRTVALGNQVYEPNVLSIGDGVFRIFYTSSGKTSVYRYKDYDFNTDTFSSEVDVNLDINGVISSATRATTDAYLNSEGYTDWDDDDWFLTLSNALRFYDGKLWGVFTCKNYYPIIAYSTDNGSTFVVYDIIPQKFQYETSIIWEDDNTLHTVNRLSTGVIYKKRVSGVWQTSYSITDSKGSRPQVFTLNNEVFIAVTISDTFIGFPENNSYRYGVKILKGNSTIDDPNNWSNVFEVTSKYGMVYPTFNNVFDDTYMTFSDSQLAMLVSTGGAIKDQGKEVVKFVKINLI